jgi:hypothetical protein
MGETKKDAGENIMEYKQLNVQLLKKVSWFLALTGPKFIMQLTI